MSSDSTVQALEIADSGFTITKEISRKGGEHIQVDLEITSTHDKQATVDLVEAVPAGTDQSQVGFMTGSEPSEWDLTEDGHLRLQSRLVAQGTRQIVYGIRDIENTELEVLAEETQIIGVGGPVGEAVDVEAELDPTLADDEGADMSADDAPTDVDEAAGQPEPSEARADGDSTAVDAGSRGAIGETLDDAAAEALAEQLAPHLEEEMELDAVTETKIAQLQEDVADMRGYLPAFEEFLGETGRAQDILDELDELRAAVDEVDDTPDDLEDTIETIDGRLASIEETAGEFDDQLEEVLARLEDLESWRADIAAASQ
jgi:soluble cytochrome b562